MGTKVKFSSALHPQTDGQSERTIQTLQDMLRACALEFHGSWDKHLPLERTIQTDGQSDRTIQTLEDILRACALKFHESRDKHLPLMEFAYNNSYQASIGMAPYEALYGRRCRTHVCWNEVGEQRFLGPLGLEMVQETTDKVKVICERLKAAQDRQKNYADKRRRDLEFEQEDYVFLRVSPWKGKLRFGKKGKLKSKVHRNL